MQLDRGSGLFLGLAHLWGATGAFSSRAAPPLFPTLGNHVDLGELPGGAEGIRHSTLRKLGNLLRCWNRWPLCGTLVGYEKEYARPTRPRHADTRFLELHRGKYRVTVAVPRPLHAKLGTRLKRNLNTAGRTTANTLKWPIVAELKGIIDRAAVGLPIAPPPAPKAASEALTIAAHRATLRDPEAVAMLDDEVVRRADEMRGDPVATEQDRETGSPVYLYDPQREQPAGAFADMALGRATPIKHHHPAFVGAQVTKARTKGDDRRALGFLLACVI
jgi:hypothetical protein